MLIIARQYGAFQAAFHEYFKCGILAHGFARATVVTDEAVRFCPWPPFLTITHHNLL